MTSNRNFFKSLVTSKQRFFGKNGKLTSPKEVVWAKDAKDAKRIRELLGPDVIIGRLDLD